MVKSNLMTGLDGNHSNCQRILGKLKKSDGFPLSAFPPSVCLAIDHFCARQKERQANKGEKLHKGNSI